jgi:hypothetical protein
MNMDFNPLSDPQVTQLYKASRQAQRTALEAAAEEERDANRQADEASYREAAQQDAAVYEARAKVIRLLNAFLAYETNSETYDLYHGASPEQRGSQRGIFQRLYQLSLAGNKDATDFLKAVNQNGSGVGETLETLANRGEQIARTILPKLNAIQDRYDRETPKERLNRLSLYGSNLTADALSTVATPEEQVQYDRFGNILQ